MKRIHVDVPEQPPVGSVVLGADGRAYQHREQHRWHAAGAGGLGSGHDWARLLVLQRDLVLLYVPSDGDSTEHQPQADDDPQVLIEWDRENNRWIRLQDGWWRVEDDPLAPRYRTRQDLAAGRGPMRTARPS